MLASLRAALTAPPPHDLPTRTLIPSLPPNIPPSQHTGKTCLGPTAHATVPSCDDLQSQAVPGKVSPYAAVWAAAEYNSSRRVNPETKTCSRRDYTGVPRGLAKTPVTGRTIVAGEKCGGYSGFKVENGEYKANTERTNAYYTTKGCFNKNDISKCSVNDEYYGFNTPDRIDMSQAAEPLTVAANEELCVTNELYKQGMFASQSAKTPTSTWNFLGLQKTGVFRNWPLIYQCRTEKQCSGCSDPRFRGWYAGAASGPKDVVIILDRSGSMGRKYNVTDPKTGKQTSETPHARAKGAVNWVINTLSWADYATVVTYASSASAYGDDGGSAGTLRPMTMPNRARLKAFIAQQEAFGGTNVTRAFLKAHEVLEARKKSNKTANCQSVVLFLTDGDRHKPNMDYYWQDSIKKLQSLTDAAGKPAPPRIFTYHFGDAAGKPAVYKSGKSFMKKVACQNKGVYFDMALELAGGAGAGVAVDTTGTQVKMASYFTYFAQAIAPKTQAAEATVRWAEMYEDGQGLGSNSAACVPIYDWRNPNGKPSLYGVLCMGLPTFTAEKLSGWEVEWEDITKAAKTCPSDASLSDEDVETIRAELGSESVCLGSTSLKTGDFEEQTMPVLLDEGSWVGIGLGIFVVFLLGVLVLLWLMCCPPACCSALCPDHVCCRMHGSSEALALQRRFNQGGRTSMSNEELERKTGIPAKQFSRNPIYSNTMEMKDMNAMHKRAESHIRKSQRSLGKPLSGASSGESKNTESPGAMRLLPKQLSTAVAPGVAAAAGAFKKAGAAGAAASTSPGPKSSNPWGLKVTVADGEAEKDARSQKGSAVSRWAKVRHGVKRSPARMASVYFKTTVSKSGKWCRSEFSLILVVVSLLLGIGLITWYTYKAGTFSMNYQINHLINMTLNNAMTKFRTTLSSPIIANNYTRNAIRRGEVQLGPSYGINETLSFFEGYLAVYKFSKGSTNQYITSVDALGYFTFVLAITDWKGYNNDAGRKYRFEVINTKPENPDFKWPNDGDKCQDYRLPYPAGATYPKWDGGCYGDPNKPYADRFSSGYNPTKRKWYIKAVEKAGGVAWTDVYADFSTNKLMLTTSIQLLDPNNKGPTNHRGKGVKHIVAVDIELSQFADVLTDIRNSTFPPNGDTSAQNSAGNATSSLAASAPIDDCSLLGEDSIEILFALSDETIIASTNATKMATILESGGDVDDDDVGSGALTQAVGWFERLATGSHWLKNSHRCGETDCTNLVNDTTPVTIIRASRFDGNAFEAPGYLVVVIPRTYVKPCFTVSYDKLV